MDQSIDSKEWQEYLSRFGAMHKDWLVTLQENEIVLIDHQPLRELQLQNDELCIRAGEFTIYLKNPISIKVRKTPEGADEALEIATDSGRTILSIDKPTLPEMVDGIP